MRQWALGLNRYVHDGDEEPKRAMTVPGFAPQFWSKCAFVVRGKASVAAQVLSMASMYVFEYNHVPLWSNPKSPV